MARNMACNTTTPAYWRKQHELAMTEPQRGTERALVQMYRSLHEYARAYRQKFNGSAIGDDGVLGDEFAALCRGFLGLLNGPTGRLDCGTLDGDIRRLCHDNNVEGLE